jgi:hypothetical protein
MARYAQTGPFYSRRSVFFPCTWSVARWSLSSMWMYARAMNCARLAAAWQQGQRSD